MPALQVKRTLATPEHVLYVTDATAADHGLTAQDVVQPDYQGRYVFFNGKKPIMDLRAIQEEMRQKPGDRPIVSVGPDGRTPTLLIQDREMEAEEVQDLLGEQYEKNEKVLRARQAGTVQRNAGNASPVLDTAWVRHVNGLPPAEQFDELFREALTERVQKHQANPVTDPGRDPWEYAKEHEMLPVKSFPDGPARVSPE